MYVIDNVEVHVLIYMGMKSNVVQMVHLQDHHLYSPWNVLPYFPTWTVSERWMEFSDFLWTMNAEQTERKRECKVNGEHKMNNLLGVSWKLS